jgi:hypothetical protein
MSTTLSNSEHIARIKRAELLSSVGAGVLGAGIALLLANMLARYAIPILLLGLISHAGGMFQKHGLEQQSESIRVRWADALYWLCWLALAALLLFIVVRQF